ncbi:hypothetical protein NLI96_g11360 [Meripilus lineatus]|uniref:F-box domain-containing protein n=1 Tax=Meripilus lineatus TaxID=2056292 RepID=A0AAD5US87_9APHY|nr:hypothetical protein NLI96_g11360 [Physisporinus lineatus]
MVAAFEPSLVPGCREALRHCTNLRSFTWIDDGHDTSYDVDLLSYLSILQTLPHLSSLTIRTSSGISEQVWEKLTQLTGLQTVSIWCLHGKPRVLQGWSEKLGDTLTHLELGVSGLSKQHPYCVPATILLSVLSQLPNLKSLRLKGAPSTSIPEILSILPDLKSLDTEYFGSNLRNFYYDSFSPDTPIAALTDLTVRTSSVDVQGPKDLWSWIRKLIPRPSLERLTLNTFSTQGDMEMPRMFLLDLAKVHKGCLKSFMVETVQMTLDDLECLCTIFPLLEEVSCSIGYCLGSEFIGEAIAKARNLRKIKLNVNWSRNPWCMESPTYFTEKEAREWMLRDNSRLRDIAIGQVLYTGQWALKRREDGTSGLEFEVIRDVAITIIHLFEFKRDED